LAVVLAACVEVSMEAGAGAGAGASPRTAVVEVCEGGGSVVCINVSSFEE